MELRRTRLEDLRMVDTNRMFVLSKVVCTLHCCGYSRVWQLSGAELEGKRPQSSNATGNL